MEGIKLSSLKFSNELSAKTLSYFNGPEFLEKLAENEEIDHYRLVCPISKNVRYLFTIENVNNYILKNMIQKIDSKNISFVNFTDDHTMPTKDIPKELQSYMNEVYKLPIENFVTPSGVYFLYYQQELVYIGKAISVSNRLSTHVVSSEKTFDSCYFIRMNKDKITQL